MEKSKKRPEMENIEGYSSWTFACTPQPLHPKATPLTQAERKSDHQFEGLKLATGLAIPMENLQPLVATYANAANLERAVTNLSPEEVIQRYKVPTDRAYEVGEWAYVIFRTPAMEGPEGARVPAPPIHVYGIIEDSAGNTFDLNDQLVTQDTPVGPGSLVILQISGGHTKGGGLYPYPKAICVKELRAASVHGTFDPKRNSLSQKVDRIIALPDAVVEAEEPAIQDDSAFRAALPTEPTQKATGTQAPLTDKRPSYDDDGMG